jgi:hypothetical protein
MVVAHSLAWLSVCLTEKMPHAKHFYGSTIMLYAAGLLEVFDFPPLGEEKSIFATCNSYQCVITRCNLHTTYTPGEPKLASIYKYLPSRVATASLRHCFSLNLEPGGHFDAHAAWHAATPLTTILFYRFLQLDAISTSPPSS